MAQRGGGTAETIAPGRVVVLQLAGTRSARPEHVRGRGGHRQDVAARLCMPEGSPRAAA